MPTEKKRRSSPIRMECPNCHEEHLARIARRGFLRNRIYPFFGLYPWQCSICGKQYLLRKRSAGYRRPPEAVELSRSASTHSDPLRSR